MEQKQTPVLINLLAIARYEQTMDYPIQFMTTGKLYYRSADEAMLRYVESQEDDETGDITMSDIELQFSGGKVTMLRSGSFSSTMVFARGQRFEGTYHTPYGDMNMAVYTKEAACRIGDQEGSMHLKYQLQIQGQYASTNEIHLEYHADDSTPDQSGAE